MPGGEFQTGITGDFPTGNDNNNGPITYTYYADNSLKSDGAATYSYDQDGNQTATAYANGVTENESYDSAGQLTRIWSVNRSGTTLTSYTYTYTNPATSAYTALRYTETDLAGDVTTNTYNAMNWLTNAVQKNAGGTVLHTYSYTYNNDGSLASSTLDQIPTTITRNATDQVTAVNGTAYTNDANGNRTSDGTNGYTYNAGTQMVGYGTSANPSQNTVTYVGAGMSQPSSSGATTPIETDSDGVRSENLGGICGTVSNSIGGVLVAQGQCGTTLYPLHDGNGSDVATTDGNGTVRGTRMYTPTGVTTSSTGTNTTAGFAGMDTSMVPGLLSLLGALDDPTTASLINAPNPSCTFTDESLAPEVECAGGGAGDDDFNPERGCDRTPFSAGGFIDEACVPNLDIDAIATKIARHAFEDHGTEEAFKGITNEAEMADFIADIMTNGSVKLGDNGRMIFWEDDIDVVVIYNPADVDRGTAFEPEIGVNRYVRNWH